MVVTYGHLNHPAAPCCFRLQMAALRGRVLRFLKPVPLTPPRLGGRRWQSGGEKTSNVPWCVRHTQVFCGAKRKNMEMIELDKQSERAEKRKVNIYENMLCIKDVILNLSIPTPHSCAGQLFLLTWKNMLLYWNIHGLLVLLVSSCQFSMCGTLQSVHSNDKPYPFCCFFVTQAVVLSKRLPEDFIENTLLPHLESQLLYNIHTYTPAELTQIARAYCTSERHWCKVWKLLQTFYHPLSKLKTSSNYRDDRNSSKARADELEQFSFGKREGSFIFWILWRWWRWRMDCLLSYLIVEECGMISSLYSFIIVTYEYD